MAPVHSSFEGATGQAGTGGHVVPGPRNVPAARRQARSVTTVQLPLEAQQAPGAEGHCAVPHTDSSPAKVPPVATQLDCRRFSVQVPLERQQAPKGDPHSPAVHVVSRPVKYPPALWQAASCWLPRQEPLGRQQAPKSVS